MNATTSSNPEKPLISVITVVYNDQEGMKKTFSNVCSQTYPQIEHVVIDGNSTDGTAEFVREHCDDIAHWISEPDQGLYDAMNKGLDRATGDFCIFLNILVCHTNLFPPLDSNFLPRILPSPL